MDKATVRFLKYFVVGFSTFLFDLLLLYILTDIVLVNYVLSAGVAFLIAVSVNYYFSRIFVFTQTERRFVSGYYWFIGIAGVGVLMVMSLMFLFVAIFGWPYLISRVLIASVVGVWNYLMNLFFNFNVAGKH
jgi:putative flippase GtrA